MTDPAPLAPSFYWIRLGENPPEVAQWHDGTWLPCGREQPWQAEGVEVVSDRLAPRLAVRLVS